MDNVGGELSKPASEISEYSLGGYLDAALRASSAQYEAPDQINRLRIKLDLSQQNDVGMSFFDRLFHWLRASLVYPPADSPLDLGTRCRGALGGEHASEFI